MMCTCVLLFECVCGVLKNEEQEKKNLIEILVNAASSLYTKYYVTRK